MRVNLKSHLNVTGRVGIMILLFLFTFSTSGQTPIPLQRDSLLSINWHPEGVLLARAFQNGIVDIIDTSTILETVIFSYSIDESPASVVRWSASGHKLAAGIGNDVHIWDFSDNEAHIVLQGHVTPIISLAWSPDDTQLASVSDNGFNNIRVWDVVNTHERLALGVLETFTVAWGNDDNPIAGTGVTLSQIYLATGEVSRLNEQTLLIGAGMASLAWNHANSQIAVGDVLGRISVFDSDGQEIAIFENTTRLNQITWSGDDQFIASGDNAGIIRIWSLASGEEVEMIDTG